MSKHDKDELLTIHEALDNLSTIAEIDPKDPYRIGIAKNHQLVIQDDRGEVKGEWLTPESGLELLDNVKITYKSLLSYFEGVKQSEELDTPKVRKGLEEMMALAGEAAHKLDKLLRRMKVDERLKKSKEYKDLQSFYQALFKPKDEEEFVLDKEEEGIALEMIKNDREYELFYLKDDEGNLFYKPQVVRKLKLVSDFDQGIDLPFEDDPLLRIIMLKDRDVEAAANQMLIKLNPQIREFYKEKIRRKESELIKDINDAIMALMLASNQRNLLQNTECKACYKYFADFQHYLRKALTSKEYQKLLAYPPEKSDRVGNLLLHLTQGLARAFFERMSGVKQEMIGYIHRLSHQGEAVLNKKSKSHDSVWSEFFHNDENLRGLLQYYPHGPIFKILDTIREREEGVESSFEPIMQDNYPYKLYTVEIGNAKTNLLHVPSPTRQQYLNKAELSEEFSAFISSMDEAKDENHLMIGLQDRTSAKEYVRAHLLEDMERRAEYSDKLHLLGLNVDSAFYYQTDDYLNLNQADQFINQFKEQMRSYNQCGYYLPKKIEVSKLIQFAEELIDAIHDLFFPEKEELSRRERVDFIELFYLFLSLKLVETLKPATMSFTCKDSIDIGAVFSGGFYAFLLLLSGKEITDKEKEELRFFFYAPAIYVRERSVDFSRLSRMISALSFFEIQLQEAGDEIREELLSLYQKDTMSPHLK